MNGEPHVYYNEQLSIE